MESILQFFSLSKMKENLTELHIIVRTTGLCFLFVRMNCILDQQLHGIMILLMKQAGTMVLTQNGVIFGVTSVLYLGPPENGIS